MMLSRNFSKQECECNCGCGYIVYCARFLFKLQYARDLAGIPFYVVSWCRCMKHNAEVGGAEDSAHPEGCGVDLKLTWGRGRTRAATYWIIWDSLKKAGFNRFGIAKTWLHVDDDPRKPKFRIWTY